MTLQPNTTENGISRAENAAFSFNSKIHSKMPLPENLDITRFAAAIIIASSAYFFIMKLPMLPPLLAAALCTALIMVSYLNTKAGAAAALICVAVPAAYQNAGYAIILIICAGIAILTLTWGMKCDREENIAIGLYLSTIPLSVICLPLVPILAASLGKGYKLGMRIAALAGVTMLFISASFGMQGFGLIQTANMSENLWFSDGCKIFDFTNTAQIASFEQPLVTDAGAELTAHGSYKDVLGILITFANSISGQPAIIAQLGCIAIAGFIPGFLVERRSTSSFREPFLPIGKDNRNILVILIIAALIATAPAVVSFVQAGSVGGIIPISAGAVVSAAAIYVWYVITVEPTVAVPQRKAQEGGRRKRREPERTAQPPTVRAEGISQTGTPHAVNGVGYYEPIKEVYVGGARQRVVGSACPYCGALIKANSEIEICSFCDTPHHSECWRENGGCTTYGCENAPDAGK